MFCSSKLETIGGELKIDSCTSFVDGRFALLSTVAVFTYLQTTRSLKLKIFKLGVERRGLTLKR